MGKMFQCDMCGDIQEGTGHNIINLRKGLKWQMEKYAGVLGLCGLRNEEYIIADNIYCKKCKEDIEHQIHDLLEKRIFVSKTYRGEKK
jgi:hypothetical protein